MERYNIIMPLHLFTAVAMGDMLTLRMKGWRFAARISSDSPASLGEDDDGTGAALERSLDGTDSGGLRGVTGQMRGATKLLEHLPVEHGCLRFTCDLKVQKHRRIVKAKQEDCSLHRLPSVEVAAVDHRTSDLCYLNHMITD